MRRLSASPTEASIVNSNHHICISVPNRSLGIQNFHQTDVFQVVLTSDQTWEVHATEAGGAVSPELADEIVHQTLAYLDACFELAPPPRKRF